MNCPHCGLGPPHADPEGCFGMAQAELTKAHGMLDRLGAPKRDDATGLSATVSGRLEWLLRELAEGRVPKPKEGM